MLRSAPVSSAELAVAGGDQRLRYRLSGTWFDQDGIVIGSGYRRFGGRLNLDFNPASRFRSALRSQSRASATIGSRTTAATSASSPTRSARRRSTPVRLDRTASSRGPRRRAHLSRIPWRSATLNTVGARPPVCSETSRDALRITPSLQYHQPIRNRPGQPEGGRSSCRASSKHFAEGADAAVRQERLLQRQPLCDRQLPDLHATAR